MKVNLNDVIECIEYENESLNHFYNKKTGVIVYREDDSSSSYSAYDIDKISELEEWEAELVNSLYDLQQNPEDYIQLPKKDDDYEHAMMINFCESFSDLSSEIKSLENKEKDIKLHTIKNVIQEKGLINEWYDYREEIEKNIAIDWCNENKIEFVE